MIGMSLDELRKKSTDILLAENYNLTDAKIAKTLDVVLQLIAENNSRFDAAINDILTQLNLNVNHLARRVTALEKGQ